MPRVHTAALLILAVSCRSAGTPSADEASVWRDSASHTDRFIETNGVRLNVLDWGGSGPPLILIHGYGDSPHIFDDIAPELTGQFRIVAYARRGHGKSSSGESFTNATLALDLKGILDSLGIAKANLAGWSMGGNEITAMAGQYPDQVGRIVYLDAGYDWSDPMFAASLGELPITLDPPPAARASLEAYKAWWVRTWTPDADPRRLEAHLRDIANAQTDGTLRPVPDSVNSARAFGAALAEPRDYRKVRAPALAIYSAVFLPHRGQDSVLKVVTQVWEARHMVPFRAASQARIRRELRDVEIVTVPGSHVSFMLVSRGRVAAAIREFLGKGM